MKSRDIVAGLFVENERLRTALQEIAMRREFMTNGRNAYEAGFNLGTDLCCDIADEVLKTPIRGADVERAKEDK